MLLTALIWGSEAPAGPATGDVAVDSSSSQTLPEGPGRDAVMAGCLAGCHQLSDLAQPYSPDQWVSYVDAMIGLGARVADEDYVPVIRYLVDNFSPKAEAP
jgi:hypothetical protein